MAHESQPVPIQLGIVGSRPVVLRWRGQRSELPPLPVGTVLGVESAPGERARTEAMFRRLGVAEVVEAEDVETSGLVVRPGARRGNVGIIVPAERQVTLLGEEEEPPIFVPPLPPRPPIVINVMDPARSGLPGAGSAGGAGAPRILEIQGDTVDLDALQKAGSDLAEGEFLVVVLRP